MGQDPDAIRREIEQTRERMDETVSALGYKADVPSRAREAVTDRVDSVKDKITGATGRVNEATPSTGEVKAKARRGAGVAQENPLGLAVGSIALGFLVGLLVPETRKEHEKLGPVADKVKDQARETGHEVAERGKQVAQQVASTAQEQAQQATQEIKQTAQGAAQEQGSELKQSTQESAQQVRDEVRS